MHHKTFLAVAAVLLVAAGLFYLYAGHQVPPGQPPLADITPQNLSAFESAFNQANEDVRLLLLLSPT